MRGLDIFVLRFLPIIVFINMGVVTMAAWNGVLLSGNKFFLGNSFIYALALFLISLSNPKYHCVWNRAMYVELMIVPLINFADAKWCIFPDAVLMLAVLSSTWVIAFIATIVLAIRHFVKIRLKKYGLENRGKD